jgi:hypothetical protein
LSNFIFRFLILDKIKQLLRVGSLYLLYKSNLKKDKLLIIKGLNSQ